MTLPAPTQHSTTPQCTCPLLLGLSGARIAEGTGAEHGHKYLCASDAEHHTRTPKIFARCDLRAMRGMRRTSRPDAAASRTHARTTPAAHARTHNPRRALTHARAPPRTHARTHARTNPAAHARTHEPRRARTHTPTPPCMHTCTHARTHQPCHNEIPERLCMSTRLLVFTCQVVPEGTDRQRLSVEFPALNVLNRGQGAREEKALPLATRLPPLPICRMRTNMAQHS